VITTTDPHIKKWYILENNKHYGPYSQIDLKERLQRTHELSDLHLWTEGMPEWKAFPHIEELANLFSIQGQTAVDFIETEELLDSPFSKGKFSESASASASTSPFSPSPTQQPFTFAKDDRLSNGHLNSSASTSDIFNTPLNSNELPNLNQLILLKLKGQGAYLARKWLLHYYRFKKTYFVALLALAFGIYQFGIRGPSIEDDALSPEQKREILNTLKESKTTGMPIFAIVKIETEVESPYFYISSNLKETSTITLNIEGIPDTLIDQFYFKMYTDLKIENGWIRTPILRQKDGKAISQGEYKFQISCKNCPEWPQSKNTSLYEKTLFLGGKRESNYDGKLKNYHLSLRKQAQSEIQDIRQISETLEKQLNDTTLEFDQLLRQRFLSTPERSRTWKTFHNRWTQLQNQLDLLYNSWSPEILSEKIFYGELYAKLKTAAADIKNIHSKQNNYIQTQIKDDQQEYEISSDISLVQSSIQQIRIKSNLTERLPSSANGMPQRLTTEL